MNADLQNELNYAGFRDGSRWREETATKGQLTRLRRFRAEINVETWFDCRRGLGHETAAESLAIVINPKLWDRALEGEDFPEHAAHEFWELVDGGCADIDDPDYLRGFVEGALSPATA